MTYNKNFCQMNKIFCISLFFVLLFPFLQGCSARPQALRRQADSSNKIGKKAVFQKGGWYLYAKSGNSQDVKQYIDKDKAYFVIPVQYQIYPSNLPADVPAKVKKAYNSYKKGSVIPACISSHEQLSTCDKSDKGLYDDCRYLKNETVSCLNITNGKLTVEVNNFYDRHKDDLNYSNMNASVSAQIIISGQNDMQGFSERIEMSPEKLLFSCNSKSCYFSDAEYNPVNSVKITKYIVFNKDEIQKIADEEAFKKRQERISDYFEKKSKK